MTRVALHPSGALLLAGVVLLPACAPIRTTVRQEERVLSSRVDRQRSPSWSYEHTASAIEGDGRARTFRAEVRVTRTRQCWERRVESVQPSTITDREWTSAVAPVIEWIVGGACTIASVIAFSVEPATQRDPMTDELRFTPSGLTGFITGGCGLAGITAGTVDLFRLIDGREDGPPEERTTESAPSTCESEPVRDASLSIVWAISDSREEPRVVARTTTDANGVAVVEVTRDALFLGGDSLRVRVDGHDAGEFRALDATYAELQRIAEEEEERAREEELRATRLRAQRARACHATCAAANSGDFAVIDREPRVLDWLGDARQTTRGCQLGGYTCTQLFIRECVNRCAAAPATDPTARLPPRSGGSRTPAEALASLETEGIAGFRIGATAENARAQCRAQGGRLDESAFASEGVLVCDGRFSAVIEGQPLPVVDTIEVRFCRARVCEIVVGAHHTAAGRGGIIAYRDAVSAALDDTYGAARRERRDPAETRTWTVGRRATITMLVVLGRRSRDLVTTIALGDGFVLTYSIGPAARRPRSRPTHPRARAR